MEDRIDPSQAPATAVRRAIADLERCRPEQLGHLESVVDVDELNGFVDPSRETGDVETMAFTYCGYQVAVRNDGTLLIVP